MITSDHKKEGRKMLLTHNIITITQIFSNIDISSTINIGDLWYNYSLDYALSYYRDSQK
jgi:hypothetical protein